MPRFHKIMEIFPYVCLPNFRNYYSKLFLLGLGVVGVTLTLKLLRKRQIVYKKYGKVLKLIINPIKSLPGIEFKEIEVTPTDHKSTRTWCS